MRLIIAEKKTLADSIATGLPGTVQRAKDALVIGDTRIMWTYGHILTLEEPAHYDAKYARWVIEDLPIVVPEHGWAVRPTPAKDRMGAWKRAQVTQLRGLLKTASEVVNAGDADREGQMLIDELLEFLHWHGPTLRLLVHDTTPDGVRGALASMKDNQTYAKLYAAALARSRADWLVGMNLSRALGVRSRRRGMSVGRVQTPTLAMVVTRDREIEGFKKAVYYVLTAQVHTDGGDVLFTHDDADQRIVDKATADSLAAALRGATVAVETHHSTKREHAPVPFMLATFQKSAEAAYGWGVKESLEVAQKLYEQGYSTYPRTDCAYLPESLAPVAVTLAKSIIASGYCQAARGTEASMAPRKSVYNDKKVAEHYALVPTKRIPGPDLDAHLLDGWKLIARRFVASLLPACEYAVTTVKFEWQGRAFQAKGVTCSNLAQSWRVFAAPKMPTLTLTRDPTTGRIMDAAVREAETAPPKRYTEAGLVTAMRGVAKLISDPALKAKLKETDGIGTAATQYATVDTLLRKGFIEKAKGKSLRATELGRYVVDACPAALANPGVTALWERALDQVASGEMEPGRFMAGIDRYVGKHVAYFKSVTLPPAPEEAPQKIPTRARKARKPARKRTPSAKTKAQPKPATPTRRSFAWL